MNVLVFLFGYFRVLNHVTIAVDFIAISLLLQCFGEHQLSHPVDTLISALDSEVVRLCLCTSILAFTAVIDHGAFPLPQFHALVDGSGNELESKSGLVFLVLTASRDIHRLEGCIELRARSERRAGNGIVVYIYVLESLECVGIFVHSKASAFQGEVMLVPFMAEHLGLALLHPALS